MSWLTDIRDAVKTVVDDAIDAHQMPTLAEFVERHLEILRQYQRHLNGSLHEEIPPNEEPRLTFEDPANSSLSPQELMSLAHTNKWP